MKMDNLLKTILVQYDQHTKQRVPFRVKDLISTEHSSDMKMKIYDTPNGTDWEEIDYANAAQYKDHYIVGLYVGVDSGEPYLKLHVSDDIVAVAYVKPLDPNYKRNAE